MRIAEIVRVDSKGRVTLPMVIRESLNIVEGMRLVIIADTDRREIVISPAVPPEAKVYELYIEIHDVPGALAQVTDELAKYDVDQVSTHCTTVKRGELAECVLIVDMSKVKVQPDEVKDRLLALDEVRMVTLKPIRKSL